MSRRALLIPALVLLAGSLVAQRAFLLETVDRPSAAVRMLALEADGHFSVESPVEGRWRCPVESILCLRGELGSAASGSRGTVLELAGGSIIHGSITRESGDGFVFATARCGNLEVSLDDVLMVRFREAVLPAASSTDDLLLMQRGAALDKLPGEILAVSQDGVRFRSAAGERLFHVQRDDVVGVVLRKEPPRALEGGFPARMMLDDGTLLRGRLLAGSLWNMRLTAGIAVQCAPDSVVLVEPASSRFQRLADAPVEVKGPQGLLDGGALPICTRSDGPHAGAWRRMLHVRAPASIVCEWPQGANTLVATLAVDTDNLARGVEANVHVIVRADGKVLGEERTLKARAAPSLLQLAVPPETRKLELEVALGSSLMTGARLIILEGFMQRR